MNYKDYKSVIALAKNPLAHESSTHIETKYYSICYHLKEKTIKLTCCKPENQMAYIFTKPLRAIFLTSSKKQLGHEMGLSIGNQICFLFLEGECISCLIHIASKEKTWDNGM